MDTPKGVGVNLRYMRSKQPAIAGAEQTLNVYHVQRRCVLVCVCAGRQVWTHASIVLLSSSMCCFVLVAALFGACTGVALHNAVVSYR